MTRSTVTRARLGLFAAVAAIGVAAGTAVVAGPTALAEPPAPGPANESPTSSANQSPASSSAASAAASPAAAADGDCSAANLAKTSASVNTALADYLTKHPDTNNALLDITRQPAFVAVGQMDSYFNEHPAEADSIRGIQAPLNAFKDRCGLQVSPTDALAALGSL